MAAGHREAEGLADIADPHAYRRRAETPSSQWHDNFLKLGHVPAFVPAMHGVMRADGFEDLSEAQKVEALFGLGSPGADLGRYCSLNLGALSKYGTLEIRRFHGTLDSALLVRWAAFCVAFVEAFATIPAQELCLPSPGAALAALQLAQETATADELLACMEGWVDPATSSYFERDALNP